MARERSTATIIPFPSAQTARPALQLVSPASVRTLPPWPPHVLDGLSVPEREPVLWLEEALISARVRSLAFGRALAQLPQTCLTPELVHGSLRRFHEASRLLLVSLELIRLGQLEESAMLGLLPGLRRAWALLRALRQELLESLGAREAALVLAEETRGVTGPLDVERELQQRSQRRISPEEGELISLVLPGGTVLEAPSALSIEQRQWRAQRLEQDFRPVNLEQDLAGWLEELPGEWLEGIARRVGLTSLEERWEQERRVVERLTHPRQLERHLSQFLPLERRILARVSEAGGMLRYDLLVLHYGGDNECAWHWAEEVPTSPLERLRRSGVLFAGQGQLGRKQLRMAVIPSDLREPVARILARLERS